MEEGGWRRGERETKTILVEKQMSASSEKKKKQHYILSSISAIHSLHICHKTTTNVQHLLKHTWSLKREKSIGHPRNNCSNVHGC